MPVLRRDDPIGRKSIAAVKPSGAKERAIVIKNDCVCKNPFSFAPNNVLENDRGEKTVLTSEQEGSLIDFAQNDLA